MKLKGENPNLMVVDDDPYILMTLEFLMKKNGFNVSVARNGNEALEQLKTFKPALILLDIMMPDVDGYEICRIIKENKKTEDIIVVFMSAKTNKEDVEKGMQAGAALYIKKPFSTRELLRQVKEQLHMA